MAGHLHDRVYDNGLTVLDTEANAIHICTTQPASYAEVATYTLGNKALAAGGIGAPAARTPNGRKVTVAAITDGTVTTGGTAGFYAIIDSSNSRLLAANALAASKAIVTGSPWTLEAFDIGIPAPA